DLLRAHLDAVLRLTAVGDAPLAHHALEPDVLVHRARGVEVEEAHLVDRRRPDEGARLVELGAGLDAAAAGHAPGERVTLLLLLRRLTRPGPELVRPVEVDPGVDLLERLEHRAPVDHQVALARELAHRLDGDDLAVRRDLVDQRRARLSDPAVDD